MTRLIQGIYTQNIGDCEIRSVAVDGNGDVIVTGPFYGTIDFPTTVKFNPIVLKKSISRQEAITADENNALKKVIGNLAYCNPATWKTDPCTGDKADTLGSARKIFRFNVEEMYMEFEDGDSVAIMSEKIRDRLGVEDINQIYMQVEKQIEIPQYHVDGLQMLKAKKKTLLVNLTDGIDL